MIREARVDDIRQIQLVRNAVKENRLSHPNVVTDIDCELYITVRGKGWVYEVDGEVVGFAIADLVENNIWALFIIPAFERKGIGTILHNTMLSWYFDQTKRSAWLSTAPGTRAEKFYRINGWREVGVMGKGEIKFEMSYKDWLKRTVLIQNL